MCDNASFASAETGRTLFEFDAFVLFPTLPLLKFTFHAFVDEFSDDDQ